MKSFVLHIFLILWAVAGLSNSGHNSCFEGVADKMATPASSISASLSTLNDNSGITFFDTTSNSISSYAIKNDFSAKNDSKHKNQNKSAVLAQRFNKLGCIHTSVALSNNFVMSDGALCVLAFLCRLNV